MRSRPRLAVAAFGTAAAMLLSGCLSTGGTQASGSAAPGDTIPELADDQQVEIKFESYNLGVGGPHADTIERLLEQFQEEHPNITVTAQPPQGGVPNMMSSVQTQVVDGNPPDVVQLGMSTMDFNVNGLGVKSLDDLVGADEVDAHYEAEHPFHERARVLTEWEGETYGIPYVFSTPTLFYNDALFRQAGLDPTQPPTTWAEVKEAAQAIKEATGKDGSYIACLGPTAGDWCLQGIIRSNGGRVLSEDRGALTFDQPETVEALATWQDLVNSGAHPNMSIEDAQDAFSRGDLGMMLQTSALQGTFLAAAESGGWQLRAAAMPSFGDKPVVPTNSGSGLFVLAQEPARQRAAWELIKFLTSDTAYEEITTHIGYLPLRTGLIDDPDGLQAWAQEHEELIRPNLEQLEKLEGAVSFPGDQYTQIVTLLTSASEEVVYRGADPQTTMAEAQRRATELLPQE